MQFLANPVEMLVRPFFLKLQLLLLQSETFVQCNQLRIQFFLPASCSRFLIKQFRLVSFIIKNLRTGFADKFQFFIYFGKPVVILTDSDRISPLSIQFILLCLFQLLFPLRSLLFHPVYLLLNAGNKLLQFLSEFRPAVIIHFPAGFQQFFPFIQILLLLSFRHIETVSDFIQLCLQFFSTSSFPLLFLCLP